MRIAIALLIGLSLGCGADSKSVYNCIEFCKFNGSALERVSSESCRCTNGFDISVYDLRDK